MRFLSPLPAPPRWLTSTLLAIGVTFLMLAPMPSFASEIDAAAPDPIDANFPEADDVVLVDWNGDGKLDVIGASSGGDYLDRWIQGATVGMWNNTSIPGAGLGRGVAAGDIDGDGTDDLVYATGSAAGSDDKIGLVLNRSSDLLVTVDNTTIDHPFSVDLADLDGDGDLDILSGGFGDGIPYWYENVNGDGETWTTNAVSTISLSGIFKVLGNDVDIDGDVDIVVSSGNRIAWVENRLNQSMTWLTHDIATGLNQATAFDMADVDGDGKDDLIGSTVNTPLLVVWKRGGSVTSLWTGQTIAVVGHADIELADLDQDGDVDIAALTWGGGLNWWENLGTGQMTGPNTLATAQGTDGALALGDVDRDGDLDFVVASGDGDSVEYIENTTVRSTSEFDQLMTSSRRAGLPAAMKLADLDGDGDLDVVSYDSDDRLVWRDTADDAAALLFDVGETIGGPDALDLADFDRDGDLDVVIATADGLEWFEQFSLPAQLGRNTIFAPIDLAAIVAVDWNGDGAPDVLGWDRGNSSIVVFTNTGSGNAFSGGTVDSAVDVFGNLELADLNGDGTLEIVAVADGEVTIYESGMSGFIATSISGTIFTRVTVGDYDLDGDIDLAAYEPGGTEVHFFENNGSGGGWTDSQADFLPGIETLRSVDMDLDGDLDIVAIGPGGFAILEGRGVGAFPSGGFEENLPGSVFAIGDLTSDGYSDVLAVNNGALEGLENIHGQYDIRRLGSGALAVSDASTFDLVEVNIDHLGRPGDVALEMFGIEVAFFDEFGTALTGGQVSGLFSRLSLARREPTVNTIGEVVNPNTSVVSVLPFVSNQNTLVDPPPSPGGSSDVDFVIIAELKSDASATLGAFQVRVSVAGGIDVRDRNSTAVVALPWSGVTTDVTVQGGLLFADGFESGDTTAWQ